MISSADSAKFDRAMNLANAMYEDKRKRLEGLYDAIGALQSTDSTDPSFLAEHDRLLEEARQLRQEIAATDGGGT